MTPPEMIVTTPNDFQSAFIVIFEDSMMLLWAKSDQERDLWVGELRKFRQASSKNNLNVNAEYIRKLAEDDKSYSNQLFRHLRTHSDKLRSMGGGANTS